jgi:hypothetical protein
MIRDLSVDLFGFLSFSRCNCLPLEFIKAGRIESSLKLIKFAFAGDLFGGLGQALRDLFIRFDFSGCSLEIGISGLRGSCRLRHLDRSTDFGLISGSIRNAIALNLIEVGAQGVQLVLAHAL